ncbi:MAG: polysaccharide deacetylase family protein, partial [Gemmatimonadota bacterium]|nr:polysaccharide deacetylase family protein [Gemmatimonadota bacterium]
PDPNHRPASVSTPRSHALYRALSAASVPRVARLVRAGGQVFCFHDVSSDDQAGHGDGSLHMAVSHFERVLEWMRDAYRVVPLSELVERGLAGRSVRGLAALTFDDAYEGFFEHGLPALARLELPATVFVVSEAGERPRPFWWDRLAEAGELTDDERVRHLSEHRGAAGEILPEPDEDARAAGPDLPASFLPATWERLESALDGREMLSVGAHTATHPNLTRMDDAELERELVGAREAIEGRLGVKVDTVSYPYGLHDERVRAVVRRAGYRAGFTLDRGWVGRGLDPMAIPRLNVPAGIGIEALECWAVGLRPGGGR